MHIQIEELLCIINLDVPLVAFKLENYPKTAHRAMSLKCKEFIGGKPKLSQTNMMASIGLETTDETLVLVCFCLRNIYVMGSHVTDTF